MLLEGAETSQIVGSKYKKITNISSENEVRLQPSKKVREKQPKKYCGNTVLKIEDNNLYKRYVYAKQDYLVYNLR